MFKSEEKVSVDEVDRKIIALLREEGGRLSNEDISRRLGMTATTVRTRIQRLEKEKLLRVVAVTDFSAAGYDLLLAIGVQVENRRAMDVAKDLAKLPEVFSVNLVTGNQDIEILVAAADFDQLADLLHDKLAKIKGVHSLTPALAVEVLKYLSEQAPIQ